MPRWVFLLGVGGLLVAVAIAFIVAYGLIERAPGVTEANVRRIRERMTEAEVEAILGGKGLRGLVIVGGIWWEDRIWSSQHGSACITFNRSSAIRDKWRVRTAAWTPAVLPPPPHDRLRAWLGW